MIIRPRSYFGWGPSGADYANPRSGLVVHYNGPATDLDGHDECVAYWKRIRSDHINGNGWADVGYSYAACRHGEVFTGRGLNRYQAAQGTTSGNANWYSVTLMLGGSERPTDEQVRGVRDLRAYLMERGVSGAVRGHRDFIATECPGDALYALVENGTFSKPPSGGTPTEEDELTGDDLKKIQKLIDERIRAAGPALAAEVWRYQLQDPDTADSSDRKNAGTLLERALRRLRDLTSGGAS
ncbi:peptidoglycan recognition protein family protein [Allonocardiopsis opalescens]|uniref:N-acetylmuramoyl-L-alanine amidase n=1 Tax=Allonocardiopsis opalescens TaxID=1144618 RepID=A0A2T0PPJ8_9ACTN|nr:peptidoglycan recognition family protein [Allonocardiopsis opalescens]PRX90814.1 N-acetylmuramoyl-L-alanine amidase [Allonocardiopsis opalescens]